MNPTVIIFAAAALVAIYYATQQGDPAPDTGSGDGDIGTADPSEGSALSLTGITAMVGLAPGAGSFANPQAMSADGLAALMQREGFAATPYPDHKGSSIGYGHLIQPGESYTSITQDQAAQILAADVGWAQSAVASAINVPLQQYQFDALTSFCFNVGAGAFSRSTLVKRINAGDPGASDEFAKWVYASGVVNQGLCDRRASECEQFQGA